eukprot:TRINITY_DN57709_c0_g1_i1.p1 TRINITY_DN57709_c0_g1~~TRINITY_DN57709_c0_g1_i1.p1  ORF type:complete len:177 (+),score=47.05 TRINITY_DN57709_c0_g1_i1:171-701(+)
MRYAVVLVLTLLFIACDIVMLAMTTTLHMQKQDKEDLMNIMLLVVHGLVIMARFILIMLSLSSTKQFRAGLFGELMKMTYKPLAANTVHIGAMPMPWVYRRWILKGSLYWDDMMYRIIAGANLVSFFASVYYTLYLHTQLANPSNYEAVDKVTQRRPPTLEYLLGHALPRKPHEDR